MNPDLAITIEAMQRFGGHFMGHLARAISAADPGNRQRLLAAFPEIIDRYGPDSPNGRSTAAWAERQPSTLSPC